MDMELTDEQRAARQTAREFAEKEIIPVARENDEQEKFPAEIVKNMASLGFLGAPIPERYGGAGMDYISYALVTEEIGRACSSVRTVLSVTTSLVALTILTWGTEEQKMKYLPKLCSGEIIGCFGLTEPDAGSDAANLSTSAKKGGSSWILNGNKMWISNGSVAKLAIIFAQTDKKLKHKGIAAFLVDTDTPGFSAQPIKGKLGLKSSDTSSLTLEDVKVGDNALLGNVGDGFKVAMSGLDNGRYSVAAGCVGICQGSVDASAKYAQERTAFGRPIAGFQLVQELIADMVLDTEAARLLVFQAGHLKNKGVRNTRETALAKLYASEAALRCSNRAIQVFGGYGYSNEYPVERYMRDARVASLYEGTSQILKLIIGRYATGIGAFT
ncbi:MAG: acyl-CoA dehydrogenase [Candidatus Abyssobacteria bacterium SURF_17]|uniref:Cyclohex-1-ene-1-carbonyl-CoA dehydrogenase n=1 Tax=Candidatus Abyssobacteria bacterium SURF_17 TaxID=2093361 RepID=A0A419EZM2_9BACT|nr:MAG: acyl-CoA dehydrogenase [Candidatus Abyssubacteria bacterium SURF_17]